MEFERYHEAVDYLQQRLWHQLPIRPVEEVLQDRCRYLLRQMGDPHLAFPVIHVGGSAGKGSTATIAAAILRAAGYRTGLYTSPHLQTFIERYDVDGSLIDPERFADLVLDLDPLVQRMLAGEGGFGRPSLVEIAFAVGMRHFADEQVDVAVVEVGLGGRTDCTNVFEEKPVTVITNIELEHTERLGRTRAAIAREKSILIRGREFVVTGERHRGALEVIEGRCKDVGAELIAVGGWRREVRSQKAGAAHQRRNAAVAAEAVRGFTRQTRGCVTDEQVRDGINAARNNGRMELVHIQPRVILDGAHNPAEARAMASALKGDMRTRGGKLHLVCGILRDKDQVAMVRALAPVADSVVVTQPPLEARQGDLPALANLFGELIDPRSVSLEADPSAALDVALARARPAHTVVVAGSMFLVGAVRERWVPEEQILRTRSAALLLDDSSRRSQH